MVEGLAGPVFEKYLHGSLKGDPASLYDAAGHLIMNGGKRIRPYLVFTCCMMLGGRRLAATPAAAAVEMVHNFTLVHDDMMDNDEMRHGVPTVHKKFGEPAAILAGDVLFSHAYKVMAGSHLSADMVAQLTLKLAGACVEVCEGQAYDMAMADSKKIPTKEQYIRMVEKKTAALFEASCAMGALCAGASRADVLKTGLFGRNLGIAFQITDDLIGVTGDSRVTKKPVGNDLREGKKSLPILLALSRLRGERRRAVKAVYGNKRAGASDLMRAVRAITESGIDEQVRQSAFWHAEKARDSLSGYSGRQKDKLATLLDLVVKRSR